MQELANWGVGDAARIRCTVGQRRTASLHIRTGIAREYTEALFIQAMRKGKAPDGGTILPPMPWQNCAQMTDPDLKALWAYLQSLKPVKNKVKPPVRAGNKRKG